MTRSVLVPTSIVREAADKREATRKLGYVARAATIFRADRLVLFPDREGERRWGGGFVETVLRYAATPPYLRKEVWGRRDELEYAGVLPPLRVASETGSGPERPGSLRQGIVTRVGPEGRVWVTCGLQHPVSLVVPPEMAVEEGERVAIRVSSREPVRARLVDEPVPGFSVERADLPEALARPDAGVRIATSRHGTPLTIDRLADLAGRIDDAGGLTVAFGSPGRGLPEILGVPVEDLASPDGSHDATPDDGATGSAAEADGADDAGSPHGASEAGNASSRSRGVEPGGQDPRFDHWLNTIPNQGSETVRTEEAMFASLAVLTLETE